jgi:hypothetical protein
LGETLRGALGWRRGRRFESGLWPGAPPAVKGLKVVVALTEVVSELHQIEA